MSYLKSSPNFIWNTSAVLGKGATGAVYAGLNKQTGESVAVKSFNHLSHMRPYEVQRREFEVLKKVNHENIVKLLAIEEENDTHHKVLIMELCTGGSLFNILDDPINCYGLEEKEFLLVLKHMAAGMKHLRDLNIIHRDLKPGNIMKFVSEDGNSIYKLTDFGAARELEEDQQFMSLYGTEEYLHPDMYERAVLRKSAGKSFRANVDLWSIGVTLFHIATGSLPFRPYGGRKNKETMFKITTEKASGIISGTQHSDNGEIEWSRSLPKSCLLSSALQPMVTQLLAGLLECDSNKMWSFEKFFRSVTNILLQRVIYVFYVNTLTEICFFCHPNDTLYDLKKRIETTVKLPVKSQLILWNKQEVTDLNDVTPTEDSPLLLLSSESTKIRANISGSSVIKFPELSSTSASYDQDAQLAKVCASMGYSIQRNVNKCVNYCRLANATPSHLICLIDGNVKLLTEKQSACSYLITSLQHQLEYLDEMNALLERMLSSLDVDICYEPNDEPKRMFDSLLQTWGGLSTNMCDKVKYLNETWAKDSNSGKTIFSAQAKAKYYCTKIRESWQTLHKDKQSRALSFNEEQLHQLEKIKLSANCKKLSDLLYKESYPAMAEIAEKLEDWYSGAQVAIVQSDCLFKELSTFMNECKSLQNCVNQVKDEQRRIWPQILSKKLHLNGSLNATESAASQSYLISDSGLSKLPSNLAQELDRLRESTKAFRNVIKENETLLAEFESLAVGPPIP